MPLSVRVFLSVFLATIGAGLAGYGLHTYFAAPRAVVIAQTPAVADVRPLRIGVASASLQRNEADRVANLFAGDAVDRKARQQQSRISYVQVRATRTLPPAQPKTDWLGLPW